MPVHTGGADEDGRLVLAEGRLVAVLVRLTDRVHEGPGAVVLEQQGAGAGAGMGGEDGRARVFTTLRVEGSRIARVARHDALAPALAEAGLGRVGEA